MEGGSPAVHSHQSPLSDDQAMDASRGTRWGDRRGFNGLHRRSDESGVSFSTVIGARAGRPGNGASMPGGSVDCSFYFASNSELTSTVFLSSGHRAGIAAGA